jgi:DNA polymerase-3 subunit epsilon
VKTSSEIVVFDVETTGTDKRRDQIIELCVQFGLSPEAQSKIWRIKPQVPISPGAQAVHGISAADLADCPDFASLADEIRELFDGARVLVGYNLSFDIDMLQAEYRRLRQPPLEVADKTIVDPFRLWQQCEPRTLMDAHRRFAGGEFEAAHSASADVAATGRVLQGMLSAFGLSNDWDEVARVCEPTRKDWIGPSNHLRWNETGAAVLGFGKHAGVPLHELASGPNAGYLRWICDKDFPPHVHEACEKALSLSAEEFQSWLQASYSARSAKAVSEHVTRPEADGLRAGA